MEKFKDRMGIYIGKIRIYEELTLEQLAAGLCSVGMLSRIERGEVEAGILLANTLLQRLGKSGDQFEWLLDKQEAESRLVRERIQVCLSEGKLEEAEILLRAYREDREKVLDVQYADIMELDLLWFRNEAVWKEKGVPPEITEKVLTVLRMTQPTYGKQPLSELLLSRAEGSLVYTYLTLLEQQKGRKATAAAWKEFLNYFMAERYVSKERVYFQPAVMLRLAEGEMEQGNPMAAYALCTEAIEELTQENRLFCYEELLELKGKAQVVLGIQDGTAGKLAEYLRTLRTKYTKGKKLWIPYEEAGNVYTVNEVIRSRRYLLGLSQEEVAGDICEPSTLWRIENGSKKVQKNIRKQLLQAVNLSGERYEYEIITEDYEDYLLRSELGRAFNARDKEKTEELFEKLEVRMPKNRTTYQYLESMRSSIHHHLSDDRQEKLIMEEQELLHALQLTFPLNLNEIRVCQETDSEACQKKCWEKCRIAMLSINEILILKDLAAHYEEQGKQEKAIQILQYVKRCMEATPYAMKNYKDLYVLSMITLISIQGNAGEYGESDRLAEKCIELSFAREDSHMLCGVLYNMAWNREQQNSEEESLLLMKQAYAIALASGDTVRENHISAHYKKCYGVEIAL